MLNIFQQTGIKPRELDLLAGGPPCQGFTKARKNGHKDDARRHLTLEYLRLVIELQPKTFLMENVPIMAQKRGVEFINKIKEELEGSYNLFPHYYNSADYGVAQTVTVTAVPGCARPFPGPSPLPTTTVCVYVVTATRKKRAARQGQPP